MQINASNFFRYYYFHLNAPELTPREKQSVKALAIFLGIISLGLIPLICACLYKRAKKLEPQDTPKIVDTAKNSGVIPQQEPKVADNLPEKEMEPIPSPKKKEETLPPLPHIFDIKIDKENPLAWSISNHFLKQNEKTKVIMQGAMVGAGSSIHTLDPRVAPHVNASLANFIGADPALMFGDHVMDTDFLGIQLVYILAPNETTKGMFDKIFNDPARASLKEKILERIEQLDTTFQLKERFKRLNNPCIFLKDLLPAWENSKLEYFLMLDEEVSALRIKDVLDDLKKLPENLLERITRIAKQNKPVTVKTTEPGNLHLIHLPYLSGKQVSVFMDSIPTELFGLLSEEGFKSVDFGALSEKTIEKICQSKEILDKLTPAQIDVCISKGKIISDFVERLLKDDRYIFPGQKSRYEFLMSNLSLNSLYLLTPYLKKEHWKFVPVKKMQEFDFTKITLSKDIVKMIFDTEIVLLDPSRAEKLIPLLPATTLCILLPYLTKKQMKHISKEQFHEIDFEKVAMTQEIFNNLFDTEEDLFSGKSRAEILIPELTLPSAYSLFKFFKDNHLKYFSKEQIKNFDFKNKKIDITKDTFGSLFSTELDFGKYQKRAEIFIPVLSNDSIYFLCKYFDKDHWKYLSDPQIKTLDFKQMNLNTEIAEMIFDKYAYDLSSRDHRLGLLSKDQKAYILGLLK